MASELSKLLVAIRRTGYEIARGKSKHIKVVDENGNLLASFPSSPSDRNWYKNAVKDIEKRGGKPLKWSKNG